jgi:hypothetical protein
MIPRPKHSILWSYINTLFCCCCFANKSKTSTWKKSQQKHWFVYKLYGFCWWAYQNKQKIISSFFCYAWVLDDTSQKTIKNWKKHQIASKTLQKSAINLQKPLKKHKKKWKKSQKISKKYQSKFKFTKSDR